MQIYPAIDIKGGRVVRMVEGPRRDDADYGRDPLEQARVFADAGAQWLHVVDMDRAFGSGGDNTEWIRRIAELDNVKIQVGGNISTLAWARTALDAGARRVILGTETALDKPGFATLVGALGQAACGLAVDVRQGSLALRTSRRAARMSVHDVVRRALDLGVNTIVYRDLDRDGSIAGADVDGAARLTTSGARVILAGGVAGLAELRAAKQAALAGVIVGRALYERLFTLEEAQAC